MFLVISCSFFFSFEKVLKLSSATVCNSTCIYFIYFLNYLILIIFILMDVTVCPLTEFPVVSNQIMYSETEAGHVVPEHAWLMTFGPHRSTPR